MVTSDRYCYTLNLNVSVLIKMLSNDAGYQEPHIPSKSETSLIYTRITNIPLDIYLIYVLYNIYFQVCVGLEAKSELMQIYQIIKGFL